MSKHIDNIGVDAFAKAMKKKLAEKRKQGRGGWDDPKQCTVESLCMMLSDHIKKADMVDIANFAMMIWYRNQMLASAHAQGKVA